MAQLPDVFIPAEAEDSSFDVLDAGWQEAEIIKSQIKTTAAKTGQYIALTFKITAEEGDKANGRMVFTNLNFKNPNPVAVKIARSDLKKICAAVGFEGELEDTEDLHNIPMMIKLSVKPENDQWPAKNEIKDYKAVD